MKNSWIYGGIVFGILLVVFGISRYEHSGAPVTNVLPAIVTPETPPETPPVTPPVVDSTPVSHYIEITGGCDWKFTGSCVNVRSGAGTRYGVVMRLRAGIVLRVEPEAVAGDGFNWYKVIQDKQLWHPERVKSDWYVASDAGFVMHFTDPGDIQINASEVTPPTNKRIVVNLTKETLMAYDEDQLFMEESISTGIEANPTTAGKFKIFRKTPSRYMQGPLPDSDITESYDLPGVAWDMYFTADGSVLHTAYWHDSFGEPMSHGCINQRAENARTLYAWADLGTPVVIEE
ncbi:MAG: L,D-transpeptidase family protein [bacterium]